MVNGERQTRRSGKEDPPTVSTAPKPVNHRKTFTGILATTDAFVDDLVSAIETVTNPHNEKQLTELFRTMAKDNVIRSKLPRYAAGTGFAKMLSALQTLSHIATKACTPEIAQAAHKMGTDNELLQANTDEPTDPSSPQRTTPHRNYHNALRKTPRPLSRLPTAGVGGARQPIPTDATFSSKLRMTAARMTDT